MSYTPVQPNIISDTFTDTNSTSIASHTPDTTTNGAAWSQTISTAFYIQSNTLQPNRKTDGDIAIIDCGRNTFSLGVTVTPFSSSSTVKNMPGVVFNYVDASNFWYFYCDSGLSQIYLYQVVAGTHNRKMTYPFTQVSGTPISLRIDQNGYDVTLWVNGREVQTYTMLSTVTLTTVVGFRSGVANSPAGRCSWDSFTVQPYLGSNYNWPIFTKSGTTPIVPLGTSGTWDGTDLNDPSVVYNPSNSTYNILYSGYRNPDSYQQLGLSSAPALSGPWTKYNGGSAPVYAGSGSNIQNGGVVYKDGTFYYVYCQGNHFDMATSTDLITWSYYGTVMSPTAATFDAVGVYDSFLRLRQDGVTFELWYVGGSSVRALGFATSTDCINWTKSPKNPVIGQQLWATQTTTLGEPSVFVPQGKEGMEYLVSFDAARDGVTGNRFIAQALTVDGMATWTYRMVASDHGATWESAQNFDSHIYFENQTMYLFHGGADIAGPSLNLDIQVGLSTAPWPYETLNRNTRQAVISRTAVT